jgi:hypothetical protein
MDFFNLETLKFLMHFREPGSSFYFYSYPEDHVWFEDRWMVASLCDE